jgi:hypothetical protein
MLPSSFQLPAAIIMLVGGLMAWLAGYRLFRIVLAIYGFILGALIALSAIGPSGTAMTIVVAFAGGVVGALILIAAYFVGVALLGAGIGALLANVIWAQLGSEPHPVAVIAFSILGAFGAMSLQRYVIVTATAFGGAWTTIVGALALMGDRAATRAATSGDVWLAYPFNPLPGQRWVLIVWVIMGVVGVAVQLGWTATSVRKVKKAKT